MLDLITRINAEEVINKEWKQKVEIPKIDFKKINSAVEIEREKSKEFLKKSLSKEKWNENNM